MNLIGHTELRFTEEQAMLLHVAQEFCRNKSPAESVRALLESDVGYDVSVWQEMTELGWSGIALPESCGGAGLGVGALVPVVESTGRTLLASPLISTALAGQLLLRAVGPDKAEPWLSRIVGGAVATVAWLESNDWGDSNIKVTLDATGQLDGQKRFVSDANAADFIVVPARRNSEMVLAVVSADMFPESALTLNTLVDLTRRSANFNCSGIRLTPENILAGDAVEGALADTRLLGALLVAAEAAGSAGACLDTVVEYLNTRKQFGKLIGAYQALKHPCVDILMELDSARSFVYHAATVVMDEVLNEAAEAACRMAKVQANDVLSYAGDRAVQFHGGMGFTWDCDAQLYIRRAQWSQQQFGDPLHHRKRLAALLLD
ncbi:MAG: acyl-CoA/acyl-ACP dehydrogenase [Halioglobus sp.]|nr:acyl-CoA/acyl-ACP dehydrogenase [Halioglobus sp.]